MKLVLVSDDVLWNKRKGEPYAGITDAIAKLKGLAGVFMVSAHAPPLWLKNYFPDVIYQACPHKKRMNGEIVDILLDANKALGLKIPDVVVLGAKKNDMLMAVNSRALLIQCEWVEGLDPAVRQYGLPLKEPGSIPKLASLLKDDAPWFFKFESDFLDVFCLTDAGTFNESNADVLKLKAILKNCLKDGAVQLKNEFIAHFMSSICVTPAFRLADWWGWYPTSKANCADSEVMSHFCTLARTTLGRRTKGPLFIRHMNTNKRSSGAGGARTDPASQLNTINLNPAYKGFLDGATVVVLDDFLTYGLSFGVAATLLKAAGAKKMIGVAMGKFGNAAKHFDIELIRSDLYAPTKCLVTTDFEDMMGVKSSAAHRDFIQKFEALV